MMFNMYIDIDKAERLNLISKIRVTVNGKKYWKVIACKHGKNGFVEIYTGKLNRKKNDLVTRKFRGNVKISFNLDKK